jgi:hypothetical protein
MKTIKINDQIIRGIPKFWIRPNGKHDHAYNTRSDEVHFEDGWRVEVRPQITENQRLGQLFFDEENDIWTYPVIDLTEEEIHARKMSGAMVITQLQGLLMLDQMGIMDTVKTMLEQNEHSASSIYFEYSPTWERDSPIIERMANLLGMNEEQLDDFFIASSKLS